MSEERPRLSLHSAEWPAELGVQREQLVQRATWGSWKAVLFVGVATVVSVGLVSLATLNAPMWTQFLVGGTCGLALMFLLRAELRHRIRDDVARLLVDNGYCVCGYPFQVQGIIRSCPECGRQWTERALPQD